MWEDLQYKLMILDVDNEFDEFIKGVERAYWGQFNLEMDSQWRAALF